MCRHFEWGGGSEKVDILYTDLNVDNYGQPQVFYCCFSAICEGQHYGH